MKILNIGLMPVVPQDDVVSENESHHEFLKSEASSNDEVNISPTAKMKYQLDCMKELTANIDRGKELISKADFYLSKEQECLEKIHSEIQNIMKKAQSLEEIELLGVELSEMIDETDRIASFAEYKKIPLLMGHFTKDSRTDNGLIVLDIDGKKRENIYIRTMTSISLGLKTSQGKINISVSCYDRQIYANNSIERAISKIKNERNSLKNTDGRLEKAKKEINSQIQKTMNRNELIIKDTEFIDILRTLRDRKN